MQPEETPLEDLSLIVALQDQLRRELILKETEHSQKSRFKQSLEEELKRYFTFHLNVIKRTINPKVRITDEDVFGDSYNFVKEIMLLISKDYRLMLHLIHMETQDSKLKQLIPAIVNVIYENSVSDDFFDKDITRLVVTLASQSIRGESEGLDEMVIDQFMRRPQCRRYGQITSKPIFLVLSDVSYAVSEKVIQDVNGYTREEFPKLQTRKSIDKPLLKNDAAQFRGLVEDYVDVIVNSEFHVPVCVRAVLKYLEKEVRQEMGDKTFVGFVWGLLFKIYYWALNLPQEIEKKAAENREITARSEQFRFAFMKTKNFDSLPEKLGSPIRKFILSLLQLPEEVTQRMDNIQTSSMQIYSTCLSVEETITLFEVIQRNPNVKELNPKVISRVNRVSEMSQKFDEFGKGTPLNELYCIFYEVMMPKEIDIDYQKKYHECYSDDKTKSLIRQILTTIEPLQVYLLKYSVDTFVGLLQKVEAEAQDEESSTQDRVAFMVNIKYFRWLVKERRVDRECKEMIEEVEKRRQSNLAVFSESKILYTKGLYNLRGYSQRARQIDNKVKQTALHIYVDEFLQNLEFKFCVSSPSSRLQEFDTNGKLVLLDYQRIHIEKWESCVHHKLQLKSLLNKNLHVVSFNQMITAFCSLQEVKTSVVTGVDRVGINMTLFWFLGYIYDMAIEHSTLKNNPKGCKDYIEILATRKIYSLIFPLSPTVKDFEIREKLGMFGWLQPKHLGIELREIKSLWELTNKILNDLDKANSTQKKLQSLKEFMKVINGILVSNQQSNPKVESIIVYALLKSEQRQLWSNIHFMELYTDPSRMLSGEGALITTLKSGIHDLHSLSFQHLANIDEATYHLEVQAVQTQVTPRDKSQSMHAIKQ